MRVRDLINLLGQEDPNAHVNLVDQRRQELSHDFSYISRIQGVSEIPVRLVLLMVKYDGRKK